MSSAIIIRLADRRPSPVKPAPGPLLSDVEIDAIAEASRVSSRAKRIGTMTAINEAIVQVNQIHLDYPLEAVILHQRDLVRQRDALLRQRGATAHG